MAFYSALRTICRNPRPRSRLHFYGSAAPFSSPSIPPPPSIFSPSPSSPALAIFPEPFSHPFRLISSHSRFFSPLCRWIPFSGPLFLSSPAWKLSQSATPLYLRGKIIILPNNLIKDAGFPIKLGVRSERVVQIGLGDAVRWEGSPSHGVGSIGDRVDERVLNLPNLISISRMVSGPVIGWMIINEWYLSSFIALAISGATDWLDGFVARKMSINSVLGSYLDPLADKVLIGSVALAMVERGLLNPGLVLLIVLRDAVLIGGAVYKRASSLGWKWRSLSDFIDLNTIRLDKVEPLFISKVNTVLQLSLVAAALVQPEFGTEETQFYITYLSWLVALTTVASSAAYGVQHLRNTALLTGK